MKSPLNESFATIYSLLGIILSVSSERPMARTRRRLWKDNGSGYLLLYFEQNCWSILPKIIVDEQQARL